jgi:hypothetical protein
MTQLIETAWVIKWYKKHYFNEDGSERLEKDSKI